MLPRTRPDRPVLSVLGRRPDQIVSGSGMPSGTEILADLMRTGKINPGQLETVREIITDGASATDIDVATYAGARGDYTITRNANGTVTVTDNVVAPLLGPDGVRIPLLDDEGTDTLSNIEIVRFTDPRCGRAAEWDHRRLCRTRHRGREHHGHRKHPDRRPLRHRRRQRTAGSKRLHLPMGGVGTTASTGGRPHRAPLPAELHGADWNLNFFRVTVSYTDLDGLAESFVSQNTARVGNNVGANIMTHWTERPSPTC